MASISLFKPGKRWIRPKKVFFLLVAAVTLYCLIDSWTRANQITSMLQQTSILGPDGGFGGFLRVDDAYTLGNDNDVFVHEDEKKDGNEIENSSPEGSEEDAVTFMEIVSANEGMNDTEIRQQFEKEFAAVGKKSSAHKLYGGTIASLVVHDGEQPMNGGSGVLTEWNATVPFANAKPFTFNPYPNYDSPAWAKSGRAKYVSCAGPFGQPVEDISVFVGLPKNFPKPSFGSYEALGLDSNLCFERDTRLGLYALPPDKRDEVNWGALQQDCVELNGARFDLEGPLNDLARSAYGMGDDEESVDRVQDRAIGKRLWTRADNGPGSASTPWSPAQNRPEKTKHEARTALLLRSYTGRNFTENDRYSIRALVSELSLRSGGEYQVFLFVHVKEKGVDLWDNATYDKYLRTSVPKEFRGMTLLWNDGLVQDMYPLLEKEVEANVHNAQWLSVQRFMQEFREFSFVWNWEMDSRVMGQAYDMLNKLRSFARKQPRRGLWERNERFYIPDYHGSYDTDFRKFVSALSGNDSVWGPPELPFIHPIGPQPRTTQPQKDKFRWGVGEEADYITLSPLFNPEGSGWVLGNQVWSYNDYQHPSESLPRRAAIVTQSRLSRRLLDIMHVENLRGNHIGSEMEPGTVALLHGLKAVYAPMPVFMDRPWTPEQRARWFNGGPQGIAGGLGSAMGWGQEGRFSGVTWYYRAEPPQRLYNNWAGYEDTGMGGLEWELANGRPCLPAMFLHPVKDVVATSPGYKSESRLPYS